MENSPSLHTDLGRRLRLFLIEAAGEGHAACDELRERLSQQQLDVYHEQLLPDASAGDIEHALAAALHHDVDAVLVWSESGPLDASSDTMGVTASPAHLPRLAVDAAEGINLFDHCFLALIGTNVDRREARHLGFEDGFTTAMPVAELVERLMREAVARARNPGSSPPCYL